jgi:hypothetical protein
MTTVLNNNGVPSAGTPNVAWPGGTPSLISLTYNVMNAAGPSAVQVTFPTGSGGVAYHTITAQYQGGNIIVNNLTGSGGSMTVPLTTFLRGNLTSGGTTFTLQPQIPVVSPTGPGP